MRRLVLQGLALLSVACLKNAPVPQAEQPVPVTMVMALGSFESDEVTALPEALQLLVEAELKARNLIPVSAPIPESFGVLRQPEERLAALAGISQPVLLVSCDPRYETQVNGRYRWAVPCDVSLGGTVVSHLEPSVHLVYYHQREAAAVEEVHTQIGREVGRVLDQWLLAGSVAQQPVTPQPAVPPPQRLPVPRPPPPMPAPPPAPPVAPQPQVPVPVPEGQGG